MSQWLLLLLILASAPSFSRAAGNDQQDNDTDQEENIKQADAKHIFGSINLASDYVLRGFTQTDHRPALQGGYDWSHPSGFSLGVWGSNVYFPDSNADLELDWTGAYQYQLNSKSALKLGLTYFSYQGDNERSSFDIPLRYTHGPFAAEIDYSPSWQNEGVAWYYAISFAQPLPYSFKSEFAIGYAVVEGDADESYPDARVSLAHNFYGLTLQATAILVKNQSVQEEKSESTVIFSASQDF